MITEYDSKDERLCKLLRLCFLEIYEDIPASEIMTWTCEQQVDAWLYALDTCVTELNPNHVPTVERPAFLPSVKDLSNV